MNYAVITYLNIQQIQSLYNTEKFYNCHIFNSLYLEANTILLRERERERDTQANNKLCRRSKKTANILKKK
jgi:uncharacterized protein YqgQ